MMTFLAIILAWLYTKVNVILWMAGVSAFIAGVGWFIMFLSQEDNSYLKNKEANDKTRARSFKFMWLALLVCVIIPSEEGIKTIAKVGGIAWVVTDEQVQEVAKDVAIGTKDMITSAVSGVASAASGSGDTMKLANELLQEKIKQEIKSTISE